MVYFNENYLFIISKMTNIYIKHDCKQGKRMHEQGILVWTVRYTITGYSDIWSYLN